MGILIGRGGSCVGLDPVVEVRKGYSSTQPPLDRKSDEGIREM